MASRSSSYAPGSPGAVAYEALARELLAREDRDGQEDIMTKRTGLGRGLDALIPPR